MCYKNIGFLLLGLLWACHCAPPGLEGPFKEPHTLWPQLGRTPQRTFATPDSLLLPLRLAWQKRVSNATESALVYVRPFLMFSSNDGSISKLFARDGKLAGYRDLKADPAHILWWQHHLIIVHKNEHPSVLCYDVFRDNTVWRQNLNLILAEPLYARNSLFITEYTGRLVCFDLATGVPRWKYSVPEPIRAAASWANDCVIMGTEKGTVYAIRDGKKLWSQKLTAAILAPACIKSNTILQPLVDGTLYALDRKTGHTLWRYSAESKFYQPAATSQETIVIGSADGRIHGIDYKGKKKWIYHTNSVISSAPCVATDKVVIGSLEGSVTILDIHTGNLLQTIKVPGSVRQHPIVIDNMLFVPSDDDFLSCFVQDLKF
ncbi:PQQ-binding-like beta-propeller repeat protein [candidate division KSB1 bacterium]|nr:PQQ-binding-like beta-propeller repeat protein [candidate division KSB1 bacterium]